MLVWRECCFTAVARRSSTGAEPTTLQATWRAHRARRTSRSATCAGHCQWHWKRTARCFFHFYNCFFIDVLVQFRRTPSRSSAPCQTLTTRTMRSWKAVAKANGEHSKRTHLGATCFEHVNVIFCNLISAPPDSPRKRRILELDPWKAPGPPGISPFEQACALNFGDD